MSVVHDIHSEAHTQIVSKDELKAKDEKSVSGSLLGSPSLPEVFVHSPQGGMCDTLGISGV